ncbi:hypothetical protein [Streptomyces sp. NPDC007063]|uniref:hypothetical protein n=1 Tax=Streptomyces sp. NPDC007063 TaxID=3364772 RepID=UPI0036899378
MPTKNDATSTDVAVEYSGATYHVPPADDWDIDVLEAIDDQRITHAVRALLGDAQYAEFRKGHRKVKAMAEFFEAAGKAVNAGNSPGSSR